MGGFRFEWQFIGSRSGLRPPHWREVVAPSNKDTLDEDGREKNEIPQKRFVIT